MTLVLFLTVGSLASSAFLFVIAGDASKRKDRGIALAVSLILAGLVIAVAETPPTGPDDMSVPIASIAPEVCEGSHVVKADRFAALIRVTCSDGHELLVSR